MSADAPFDVLGPLPAGVTVLEASAGTGKTYTLAALAARYVADGLPLDRLLLVTFTRMATGELRTRVRERLVHTHRALATGDAGGDPVAELLLQGDVAARCRNLAEAVAGFDAATITTIHGFCAEALAGIGVTGDAERDATVVEDAGDLLEQVVDDLLVRRWHARDEGPPFRRADALRLARAAVATPTAPLLPAPGETPLPALRAHFATVAREQLDARKRRARLLTYDDLLTRLRAVLLGPDGDAAVAVLRARFDVVLVDEFQDTDPAQWDIVERAFAPSRALVLIGDPKQAIYAFRGADVHAYLRAARVAGARATLGTNHRSDGPLLRAFDGLFDGARLGHDEIVHRHVEPAPGHREARLRGAGAPLRVRVAHRDDGMELTGTGFAQTDSARAFVARDVAAQVVALLESGATIDGTALAPGDVAVLTRTHVQARLVHGALRDADVPAVSGGAGSVFGTPAAGEWLTLLEALERPSQATRAHAAALTCFVGWGARRLAEAGDADREALHRRLHAWARLLREAGVASLVERLTREGRLAERVLAERGGERRLTDVRHVGELLHRAATAERLGVTALAAWLRARIDAAGTEEDDEERTRRLESDADAVQVLTIHRAKGLEFPVVLCPYLWDVPGGGRGDAPVVFHDEAGVRTVDVGLQGPGYLAHRRQAEAEARGEDLRLAYVAVTRARHAVVLWWAGSWASGRSPLGRLVVGRGADGSIPDQLPVPLDPDAQDRFAAMADRAPGCIAVERAAPVHGARWRRPPLAATDLGRASFGRELDRRWRRTSYSAIVAGAHEGPAGSEPEAGALDDEPAEQDAAPAVGGSPWDVVPGGRRLGTLAHRVLERTDFAAADLGAELRGHLDGASLEPEAREALVAGLRAAIGTPLGPLADGVRLRDVARADRLDELTFELPLTGGDRPSGEVTLGALADALASAPLEGGLAGYPERLRTEVPPQRLRGFLTGSIDLVLRLPGGRFAIVDHKTNRLDAFGPAALAEAMQRSHYVLQGLLYAVALHRYLRWRLPRYDPDDHLAGIAYLFLRGMPEEGVFAWRPPGALVAGLSDVLDRGAAA